MKPLNLTEQEIIRMKVRTHRRTPRWVLVTRVIAFLVLVILLYLSPRLFASDGAIDLGLKWTADRINFHLEHQAGYYAEPSARETN